MITVHWSVTTDSGMLPAVSTAQCRLGELSPVITVHWSVTTDSGMLPAVSTVQW